jgi:hypothetical protein
MTSAIATPNPPATDLRSAAVPAWLAEPACCCRCQPRFCVQVPLPGRAEPADLLLCAYHLQVSLGRLAEVGAWVYDARNRRLNPADWI